MRWKMEGAMSNETLRVRVGRAGRFVLMEVLTMPEQFRHAFGFTASNNVRVRSSSRPSLGIEAGPHVYLRGGNTAADSQIAFEEFDECGRASEHYDKLVVALREAKAEMERIMNGESEAARAAGFTFDESDLI